MAQEYETRALSLECVAREVQDDMASPELFKTEQQTHSGRVIGA